MDKFDKVVEKELYFINQRHKDNSEKYRSILLSSVGSLAEGKKSLFKIKKELRSAIPGLDITDDFVKLVSQHSRIITGDKNSEFSLSKESYAGLSFKESLEDRQRAIVKSSFAFIVEAKNVMAENRAVSTLINNEAKKYKRRDDMFYNTQTKAAREYSYRSVDDKNNNIKGWLSIAVLDNKTSVICVGLANKYYSVKQYPKREDIPNQIPRHPNCRSMLVGVEYGERIQSYMTQTADDFMHRNPKTAIDFLGEEKHKLWLESETSINNFIDLKNGALFTNEEIERKFL